MYKIFSFILLLLLLPLRAEGETSYHLRYAQHNKPILEVESSVTRLLDFLTASEIQRLVVHLIHVQ